MTYVPTFYTATFTNGRCVKSKMIPSANWQTQQRGTNDQEYQIYLACADNGKGGDITRNGAPFLTYDQWLAA
jgi:hypothetical protein